MLAAIAFGSAFEPSCWSASAISHRSGSFGLSIDGLCCLSSSSPASHRSVTVGGRSGKSSSARSPGFSKGSNDMLRTTADVLADRLIDCGVRVVSGLPGDGINGIMEALRTLDVQAQR